MVESGLVAGIHLPLGRSVLRSSVAVAGLLLPKRSWIDCLRHPGRVHCSSVRPDAGFQEFVVEACDQAVPVLRWAAVAGRLVVFVDLWALEVVAVAAGSEAEGAA